MTPARTPKRGGARALLMTVVGRSYPRIVGTLREPSWIFFELFLPLVALCAYVFVYRALHAPERYVGFVVVGGAMVAFWTNVLWSMGSQLYWEKSNGNLGLYIMAPCPLMAILLGMAMGGMVATTIRAAVVLALGVWFFHVHFAISSVPHLVLVFALAMTALYGLGMMFASLFLLLGREAQHLAQAAMEPVLLLSGFFFPLRSFPGWLAAASSILPLSLGLDALRQVAFAGGPASGFLSVPVEEAALAVLAAVFLVCARGLLRHMERLAVSEGRLTERGA